VVAPIDAAAGALAAIVLADTAPPPEAPPQAANSGKVMPATTTALPATKDRLFRAATDAPAIGTILPRLAPFQLRV
jgi:hypothetical protein